MWHSEPLVLELIPNKKPILLLIRDPRDVALSAVDFIDKTGSWPAGKGFKKTWSTLNRKEKLALIIDNSFDSRNFSIINNFEVSIKLSQLNNCVIVKYEDLHPTSDISIIEATKIANFFGIELDEDSAKSILKKSFKNGASWTLNKAKINRYLDEDSEIIELLESKLSSYIDYFKYSNFEYSLL